MKRKLITLAIIILCFLLQSTIFPSLAFACVQPNLFIIVTASFGFMRGRKEGMAVGVICGLLTDVFWGNTIGFYILLYTVIGYLNGTFERLFYDEDIKLPLVLISGSELIYGGIICFCGYILKGDFSFGTYLIHIILPELVYTILATLIVYQIIPTNMNFRFKKQKRSKEPAAIFMTATVFCLPTMNWLILLPFRIMETMIKNPKKIKL